MKIIIIINNHSIQFNSANQDTYMNKSLTLLRTSVIFSMYEWTFLNVGPRSAMKHQTLRIYYVNLHIQSYKQVIYI